MWKPFLLSLGTATILGFILIPILRKLKIGQVVRDDGPRTHLSKTGVPTMGGFIFIIPLFAFSLIYAADVKEMIATVVAITAFAFVGFLDDFLKIIRKSKDGLSVLQKTIMLVLFSSVYSVYYVIFSKGGTEIFMPFSALEKTITIPAFIYIPFLIIFLYWITNSVNLTDGVDGLASGVTGLIIVFFILVGRSFTTGFEDRYLILLCALGAVSGFLFFNSHPARVFMGDTGSMALGGLIGILAIQMKIPWVLFIAGIIFIAEALSVVIQVGYFKLTHKRVFKMAPIHHHYELSGWKEQKVVLVFGFVTIIACFAAYALLGLF